MAMKKCPFCAEEIQEEAILCRYCGSKLTEETVTPKPPEPKMKKCPFCAEMIPAEAEICEYCENKQDGSSDMTSVRPTSPVPRRYSAMPAVNATIENSSAPIGKSGNNTGIPAFTMEQIVGSSYSFLKRGFNPFTRLTEVKFLEDGVQIKVLRKRFISYVDIKDAEAKEYIGVADVWYSSLGAILSILAFFAGSYIIAVIALILAVIGFATLKNYAVIITDSYGKKLKAKIPADDDESVEFVNKLKSVILINDPGANKNSFYNTQEEYRVNENDGTNMSEFSEESEPDTGKCPFCSGIIPIDAEICMFCGNDIPVGAILEINEKGKWVCKCGEKNSVSNYYCMSCGRDRPKGLWTCSCGCKNPASQDYCTVCGKAR